MIRSLSVNNKRGKTRVFTLGESSGGLKMERIDGLGPVNADLNFADLAIGGAHFVGSFTGKRNILVQFSLQRLASQSMEATRSSLYTYFYPGRPVELVVMSDIKMGVISGYVESVTPDIFSKEPMINISIMCENPMFRNNTIGQRSITLPKNGTAGSMVYAGSVDTGVTIEITIGTVITHLPAYFEFREAISGTGQNLSKSFIMSEGDIQDAAGIEGYRFQTGDVIRIVTNRGQKSATLQRNGSSTRYNVFDAIRQTTNSGLYLNESMWPELLAYATSHSFLLLGDDRLPSSTYTVRVLWDTYFEGY